MMNKSEKRRSGEASRVRELIKQGQARQPKPDGLLTRKAAQLTDALALKKQKLQTDQRKLRGLGTEPWQTWQSGGWGSPFLSFLT